MYYNIQKFKNKPCFVKSVCYTVELVNQNDSDDVNVVENSNTREELSDKNVNDVPVEENDIIELSPTIRRSVRQRNPPDRLDL